ncbi:sugar ABC transporter permease [Agromyces sp. NPDC049794]|uniref:carbohydrate ABC transporter permease n=1 Tax=unclassified Agromyces TaxID=2639701 RepID=UPI0033FB84CD
MGQNPIGALFSLPYAIFLVFVFLYPLGFGIYIAFHDYFFAAPGAEVDRPFVGLDNFQAVLTDPKVLASFGHIGVFLVINVPLTIAAGLLLATALNRAVRFVTAYRVAYYVPYVTASVATVTIWMFMFSSGGIVNSILGPLAPDPSWLVNSVWAMPMIALYVTWKQLGFFILLYLAALQNIPKELYESAKTDGASAWWSFRAVTWPGVRPATALVATLAIITGANLFTEPYLLTGGGGPNGASTTPVLLIYQEGIQQNHPGIASAIGILLVVLVLALSWIARRATEGRHRDDR